MFTSLSLSLTLFLARYFHVSNAWRKLTLSNSQYAWTDKPMQWCLTLLISKTFSFIVAMVRYLNGKEISSLYKHTHTHSVIQTQPHIRHHKYRFIRYVHIGDDEQIFVGFWQIKALHLTRFRKLVCKMNKTIWIFLYAIPQKKKHNYSEVRLWTQPAKSDSDFKNQARPKKIPVSGHQVVHTGNWLPRLEGNFSSQ